MAKMRRLATRQISTKRRFARLLTAAFLLPVLAACTHLELAGKDTRTPDLHTARQWQIVANDVASRLVDALGTKERAYLIEPPAKRSLFTDNMVALLASALVAKQAEVVADADAQAASLPRPWIVNLQTMVIPHGPTSHEDRNTLPSGSFTLLGSGVYLATRALGLGDAALGDPVTSIGGGMLADAATLVPPKRPAAELIVTTSVAAQGRFRYRQSDVYIIDDDDFAHYVAPDSPQQDRNAGDGVSDGVMTVLYDPMHETVSDALARADRHCARNGGRAVITHRTRADLRDHGASFRCVRW